MPDDKRNVDRKEWTFQLRRVMLIFSMFVFFGLLYPELCLGRDTLTYRTESDENAEVLYGNEIYYSFLEADPSEIKIKSKLWEYLKTLF